MIYQNKFFEIVKEENSIVISGNDSNEIVKSLKKYMNLIFGKVN